MAEAGKSAWCREQGIYPAELDKWCSSASAALAESQKVRASPQVTRYDRKRIKELDARTAAQGHSAGARLHLACNTTGIDPRTLQRYAGLVQGDGRPQAVRPVPSHALSQVERAKLLSVASESSFARVLRTHDGTSWTRQGAQGSTPTTHIASTARQVWCWDMTYLPATVMGRWFYLYLILDLYSRKIVGWEVHDSDTADHAAHLVQRTALAEGIAALTVKPVLHGDNGSTLKATTVLSMLHWLGVKPSYSRPRVSDDNAYAESLFRTAKYRPEFPARGFADLHTARAWAADFVHWYNVDHRHSAIQYVSPSQRHEGEDQAILAARHALYLQAREKNPARWSGDTRNWSPIGAVTLNPQRDCVIKAHSGCNDIQQLAA